MPRRGQHSAAAQTRSGSASGECWAAAQHQPSTPRTAQHPLDRTSELGEGLAIRAASCITPRFDECAYSDMYGRLRLRVGWSLAP